MSRLLLLLAPFVLGGPPSTVVAQTPTVLANRFFDAVRAKDAVGLRGLLDPDARIFYTATDKGVPVVRSVSANNFIAAATKAQTPWDERLKNVQAREDGNVASVWAAFDFYENGQVKFCGKLVMQLVRSAGGWRVAHVAESQRAPPCPS